MYGVLFRVCVSFALGILVYEYGDVAKNEKLNFILEDGANNRGDAQQLYGLFKKDRRADPIMRNLLGPVLDFRGKKESPGCQAADLKLGGAMLQTKMEHAKTPERPIEDTDLASADAPLIPNKAPSFRLPITREVLESLKNQLFMEAEARRKFPEVALTQSRLLRG
jgi:hypothetical protein